MGKILVTPRSLSVGNHPELERLEDAGHHLIFPSPGKMPSETDLLRHVPECQGWLAGVEPVSEAVIAAASKLKVISRNGSGIDSLPLTAIRAAGIRLFKAEGANARGVSELALAFMLAGLRHIVTTHEGIQKGDWPRMRGRELCDCTVGVIGIGAVGSLIASLTAGLGAEILAFDPFAKELDMSADITLTDLATVCANSDVVTLHCPMPEDGKPVLDRAYIGLLKPDVVLVNTARAGLVDEAALVDRLNACAEMTYATDVFETEPPKRSPLTTHSQILMTSHIGGFTASSVQRSTERAVDNLLLGLQEHAG